MFEWRYYLGKNKSVIFGFGAVCFVMDECTKMCNAFEKEVSYIIIVI